MNNKMNLMTLRCAPSLYWIVCDDCLKEAIMNEEVYNHRKIPYWKIKDNQKCQRHPLSTEEK